MPAKAPMYLKTSDGKHATATKGSKKLREILSTDMISPPLGDLRHISHVGRGGPDDTFGDTSFLQKGSSTQGSKKNDGGVSNGSGAIRSSKKGSKKGRSSSVTHEQTSTLDRFKKKKHSAKLCMLNGENSPASPPILQSAFSMPVLTNDSTSPSHNNSSSEETNDQSPSTNNNTIAKNKVFSKSEEGLDTSHSPEETPTRTASNGANGGGPPKPRRIMSIKSASSPKESSQTESSGVMKSNKLNPLRRSSEVLPEMTDDLRTAKTGDQEDDGWSLDLDLGPSLMDAIMGIMDKSKITS